MISQTGLFKLSDEEYFAHPAVSNSSLGLIADSPKSYAYFKNISRPKTKSMELGSATHAAILEPEVFRDRYVKAPDADRRTKAGKDTIADFSAKHPGKTLVAPDEWEAITEMANAVREHKSAAWALSRGLAEHAVFWNSDIDDTPCKAKIDFLNTEEGVLVDLKTTDNAHPYSFAKSIATLHYHRQAAMYLDGVRAGAPAYPIQQFVFVVVQNRPPFHVATYTPDEDMIKRGRDEYRRLLETLAYCRRTSSWPGLPEVFQEISLPSWYGRAS